MAIGLPDGPKHSHIQSFFPCYPPNDRGRVALSVSKFGRLSLLCLFLARILILLLLMSDNIHPNPVPVFVSCVFTGGVDWCDAIPALNGSIADSHFFPATNSML